MIMQYDMRLCGFLFPHFTAISMLWFLPLTLALILVNPYSINENVSANDEMSAVVSIIKDKGKNLQSLSTV